MISESLEAHIEELSYSADNHASDRYAITDSKIIAKAWYFQLIPLSW